MNREPIGTGRLPALGDCLATIFSTIGVDLLIPQKPTSPQRDGSRLARDLGYVTEHKGGRGGGQVEAAAAP